MTNKNIVGSLLLCSCVTWLALRCRSWPGLPKSAVEVGSMTLMIWPQLWFDQELRNFKVLGSCAEGYALLHQSTSLSARIGTRLDKSGVDSAAFMVLLEVWGILFSDVHVSLPVKQSHSFFSSLYGLLWCLKRVRDVPCWRRGYSLGVWIAAELCFREVYSCKAHALPFINARAGWDGHADQLWTVAFLMWAGIATIHERFEDQQILYGREISQARVVLGGRITLQRKKRTCSVVQASFSTKIKCQVLVTAVCHWKLFSLLLQQSPMTSTSEVLRLQ